LPYHSLAWPSIIYGTTEDSLYISFVDEHPSKRTRMRNEKDTRIGAYGGFKEIFSLINPFIGRVYVIMYLTGKYEPSLTELFLDEIYANIGSSNEGEVAADIFCAFNRIRAILQF
jgi:hypothetical protein